MGRISPNVKETLIGSISDAISEAVLAAAGEIIRLQIPNPIILSMNNIFMWSAKVINSLNKSYDIKFYINKY